ncbi:hypothetical protein PybrP1_011994 [[Pythium] brassicae (nom. inval.)]|nr:hypothetical protein PybrP1_011994 [[Pythium] brassicae (nom. inval.)]
MASHEDGSRDGAKRRGASLGPQASQILQRLYEPQLGPASALSPSKQKQQQQTGGATKNPLSPIKKDPLAFRAVAAGGGGVLKPKQRMRKTTSVTTLAPADVAPKHLPRGRLGGVGGGLAASASVAVFEGELSGVSTLHPTLLHATEKTRKLQGKETASAVASRYPSLVDEEASREHADASLPSTAAASPAKAARSPPSKASRAAQRQKIDAEQSFTASLNLDPRYLSEFRAGNFLYLRKKRHSDLVMYALEVVEHFEVDRSNYFTMSIEGVTHFTSEYSEFWTLDKWELEYARFMKMLAIPFFQRYKLWKNYNMWKQRVRAFKTRNAKKALNDKLFLLTPSLQSTLLGLRALCLEVAGLELIFFRPRTTYSLREFEAEQKATRDSITAQLAAFSARSLKLCVKACDAVIDGFLEANKISADHKMTFMERAALRKECRNLTNFLRLADFLTIDATIQLTVRSFARLYDVLAAGRAHLSAAAAVRAAAAQGSDVAVSVASTASSTVPTKPAAGGAGKKASGSAANAMPAAPFTAVFAVSVETESGAATGMSAEPGHDAWNAALQRALKEALRMVETPARHLGHDALAPYTTASAEDEGKNGWSVEQLNVALILNEDAKFSGLTNEIFVALDDAFEAVEDYIEVFAPYQHTYAENETQAARLAETYERAPLEFFTDSIDKYRAQAASFADIPDAATVGIFRVDSAGFKSRLLPNPDRCVLGIRALLPTLMKKGSAALLETINELSPVAFSTPSTPESFVQKVVHMAAVGTLLPELKARYRRVYEMGILMDNYDWRVPDDIKEDIILMKEGVLSLEGTVTKFEGEVDSDTARFSQVILDSIAPLSRSVNALMEKLDHPKLATVKTPISDVLAYLKTQEATLGQLVDESKQLMAYQTQLKQPVSEFSELNEVAAQFELKMKLWSGLHEWQGLTVAYAATPFDRIDVAAIGKQVQLYAKTAYQAQKQLPGNEAAELLQREVDKFKLALPVVSDLRSPALQERHWAEIHRVLGFPMKGESTVTLGALIERNVMKHVEAISAVAVAAQQEAVLEEMLKKVTDVWAATEFEVKGYKESKDVFVLGSVEDVTAKLDDSIVTISTILGSRFIGAIQDEVEAWRRKLVGLQETLDEWLLVQKNWMYLENIFAAPDIQRQLPDASKIFSHVDGSWKAIMRRTNDAPHVLTAGTFPGIKETLQQHNAHLDRIQKNLEDYLETKRMAFPRFYFLSNDELLEILAQSKNPQAVQPHLRKCFENLVKLDFGDVPGSVDILAMLSSENERVPLGKNLKARGNVEDWLKALEGSMKASIYKLMKAGLLDYDTKARADWVCDHPGQVVATVAQMTWARSTEDALAGGGGDPVGAMHAWFTRVVFELNELIVKIRGDLTPLERKVIVALVTTDVHARDIVECLWSEQVESVGNFIWQQQLRYYWDAAADDVLIRHSDSAGLEAAIAAAGLQPVPTYITKVIQLFDIFNVRFGGTLVGPTGAGKSACYRTLQATMTALRAQGAANPVYQTVHARYVAKALQFVRKKCHELVPTVDMNLATSLCRLFGSLFSQANGVDYVSYESDELLALLDKVFAFCLFWSIGATMTVDRHELFDSFARELLADAKLGLPNSGLVFDYFVDMAQAKFRAWHEIVPRFQYNPRTPYFKMTVATPDTVRFTYLLRVLMTARTPAYVTGVTGTGKTVIVQDLLLELQGGSQPGATSNSGEDEAATSPPSSPPASSYMTMLINFSAQTSSLVTQATIESKLEKKRKNLLGPAAGKRMILFVDDVNLPAVEEYGAQAPIELLRQLLDFGGFYDRDKLFWKDVADTMLLVAAAPAGGGRSHCTPRFVRHFHVLSMYPAGDASLQLIFASILGGFLDKFPPPVKALRDAVIASVIEIYARVTRELLPTPSKFHYTFNLRDVSKVFQGVLMVTPAKCPDADTMSRLWVHEATRVFQDRLTTAADQRWYEELACSLLARNFARSWGPDLLFHAPCPLTFVDFLKPGVPTPLYEHCGDLARIAKAMDDFLESYNVSFANKMHLVFFRDAIGHLARLARVLRQPRGNAMLIGVGGSGKQSLARLAAFMVDAKCVQLEITRGYGAAEFHEDLKKLMVAAGVGGASTVFLFTDSQIVDESFLEDINNVLNSGEVPNLFPPDEMDRIVGDMRPVVKALELPETRDNCVATFIDRVRSSLHIVLAMSPVGSALRVRCRAFPSLINCCTIDWYMNWPTEALQSVADRLLAHVALPSEDVRVALVAMCAVVHTTANDVGDAFLAQLQRHVYTTPKSYLDLISLYLKMLEEKRAAVQTVKSRMEVGVKKLEETNNIVDALKRELLELQPVLQQKAVEAEELLKRVSVDQKAAAVVRERVSQDEAVVAKQAEEVAAVQADAQKDLDVAMPALSNAVKALDSLSKSDITEVKSFAKPPEAVETVMNAVCLLLNEKQSWDAAKKVLSDVAFLDRLKGFDKDNIPAATLKKLGKSVADPGMAVEVVAKVSRAATSLCMWVHAMDVYSRVAKEVGPKRETLERMNTMLADANAVLQEKQRELRLVNESVARLETQCKDTVDEKDRLARDAEVTEKRLVRAEKLIAGLSVEGARWKESVALLATSIRALIGDTFLAAACISYYGPFTGGFRARIVARWLASTQELGIPCSAGYSLVTKMTNANLLRALETCIRNGKALLIEDIDEALEPALEPILQKAVFKQGGRLLLRLGDADVDYDPSFRLFLTTKLPNPHYLPEVYIKVTVINFTVTMDGLEDQLLGDVVRAERPDIEEKKNRLVVTMAQDKRQLQEIEDRILKQLSESAGNVLDDQELIDTLQSSNATSRIIKERVLESESTEIEINRAREAYRGVATRGSIIYFVVADLALVDPMYQYSLPFFQRLFNACFDAAPPADALATRLATLVAFQTRAIYVNICRGLFEVHKVLFAMLICCKIMLHAGAVSPREWSLYLRGATAGATDRAAQLRNPAPDRISELQWDLLTELESVITGYAAEDQQTPLFGFAGLCASLTAHWAEWRAWLTDPDFLSLPGPDGCAASLSAFQKLLLVKGLAEEKVPHAVLRMIAVEMGAAFGQLAPPTMEEIYSDTDRKTPCIFVLSAGADPTGMLLRFAKEMAFSDRLHLISLGQGQGPRAEKLIEASQASGDWVLLQNCHLAKSWMPKLERLVDELAQRADDGCAATFRLFLTSFPAAYFPVTVLQNGIKLTNEPPKGIRANLVRSFTTLATEDVLEAFGGLGAFDDGLPKAVGWKTLLCALAFFHATIQERRKFGPLGWNIKYEFNDTDLETSLASLRKFLEEQPRIPWDALRYVTGQINYGGRVTDDWDRRCLTSLLDNFYTPAVLADGYAFSASGTYRVPRALAHAELLAYLTALPALDNPELFGMHENANVTYERNESASMARLILSLEPRDSSGGSSGGTGGGKSSDQRVLDLASSILDALPPDLSVDDAGLTTFKTRLVAGTVVMDSLATVLGQELVKFNALLRRMRSSLADIQRAISGLIVMSSELDNMYTAFLNGRVPQLWASVSFASLKPLGPWAKDLLERLAFFRAWLLRGEPAVFQLNAFFFPQGFMTGTLQNFARKYQTAIDSLAFTFAVLDVASADEVAAGPADGILVDGLWLEGARWSPSRARLEDARPGEMFSPMAVIHFLPAPDVVRAKSEYPCPVYKTSVRQGTLSTTGISTNFVIAVYLPTEKKPDYWVMNGAAFLLNLNS